MNINTSSEKETKQITFGLVFSWLFSVLVGVPSIVILFNNPIVGLILLISAIIVFPPANKMFKDKFNFSLSRGLKIVIVIILFIIAGSMSSKDSSSSSKKENNTTKQTENTQPKKEVIKVTAIKIGEEYKANEVAADAKYKGNVIEVTGIVETIGKDVLDNPYITLKGNEYDFMDKIQCMFSKSDESQLATIVKDRQITLSGEVSGKMGNILVRGCQIVK